MLRYNKTDERIATFEALFIVNTARVVASPVRNPWNGGPLAARGATRRRSSVFLAPASSCLLSEIVGVSHPLSLYRLRPSVSSSSHTAGSKPAQRESDAHGPCTSARALRTVEQRVVPTIISRATSLCFPLDLRGSIAPSSLGDSVKRCFKRERGLQHNGAAWQFHLNFQQ